VPERGTHRSWVCAVILLATLGGCASAATTEGMTVARAPQVTALPELLQHSVHVRSVLGGEPTNPLWTSEVGNPEFRQALESSLRNNGLLADGTTGDYALDATLIDVTQPMIGFDLTVTSTVRYIVTPGDGTKMFDDTVIASYTAGVSESFLGTERLRRANEGSIRENIKTFIERLVTFYRA
jgi:hypothetical protein